MEIKKKLTSNSILALLFFINTNICLNAFSEDFLPSISATIEVNNLTSETSTFKTIQLVNSQPSEELKARFEKSSMDIDMPEALQYDFSPSPDNSIIDLGMNGVPVLDQGQFGTCVTFATTAVLDALLNKGDFIDQQCFLAHSLALGNNYWFGLDSSIFLIESLKKFGIVPKNKCGVYPNPTMKVPTLFYTLLADKSINLNKINYEFAETITVDNARTALFNGRRILINFYLKKEFAEGYDVYLNGQRFKGGMWACKSYDPLRNDCEFTTSGHEAILIGYNDKLRLFKLRNSWGSASGVYGEYYMTYEFFSIMVKNGTVIW